MIINDYDFQASLFVWSVVIVVVVFLLFYFICFLHGGWGFAYLLYMEELDLGTIWVRAAYHAVLRKCFPGLWVYQSEEQTNKFKSAFKPQTFPGNV